MGPVHVLGLAEFTPARRIMPQAVDLSTDARYFLLLAGDDGRLAPVDSYYCIVHQGLDCPCSACPDTVRGAKKEVA